METVDILGVKFNNTGMEAAVSAITDMLNSGETGYVVTPNSEIVYECIGDAALRSVVNGARLVLPDGAGVVLASKILGTPLKEKVAGVVVAEKLLPKAAENKLGLYLLGAKAGVAERAAARMRELAPGINICGTCDGYFKDDMAVVRSIRASQADLVYVCLGFPKQEHWMSKYSSALEGCIMLGLGGSLDVFAGEVKRAPDLFVRMNLEWFYRLIKQPSRLGRMMRLPKFLAVAIKKRLTEKRGPKGAGGG